MSTLIRVDELPAAERFEFLHEMVAQTWVPMECHSDHRADYRAVLRSSGLVGCQSWLVRCDGWVSCSCGPGKPAAAGGRGAQAICRGPIGARARPAAHHIG